MTFPGLDRSFQQLFRRRAIPGFSGPVPRPHSHSPSSLPRPRPGKRTAVAPLRQATRFRQPSRHLPGHGPTARPDGRCGTRPVRRVPSHGTRMRGPAMTAQAWSPCIPRRNLITYRVPCHPRRSLSRLRTPRPTLRSRRRSRSPATPLPVPQTFPLRAFSSRGPVPGFPCLPPSFPSRTFQKKAIATIMTGIRLSRLQNSLIFLKFRLIPTTLQGE
jgi:hypothetical protein